MLFTERLYGHVLPIWEKSRNHAFLRELGEGTLAEDTFAFYMEQDYVFLIEYAKLFALGVVRAKDMDTMARFASILDSTLHVEMALHRSYASRIGISQERLEAVEPAAATIAYTRYLLSTAQNGSLAELVAVLLPCMWSYREIGRSLAEQEGSADHPLYGEWIRMYASDEFDELVGWLIGLMNRLAEGLPERELAVLERHFAVASRYEYLFWEMAYEKAMWPL